MSILRKIFGKKVKSNHTPSLSPELHSQMFVDYGDGLVFNAGLANTTLGQQSPQEILAAQNLVDNAIWEIGNGQILSDYDFIFMASFEIFQAMIMHGATKAAYLPISKATSLYGYYSPKLQETIDKILFDEPSAAVIGEVYKKLGPGEPTDEGISGALEYLMEKAKELRQNGKTQSFDGDEVLVYKGLSFDDLTQSCLHFVNELVVRGDAQRAWEITVITMCPFNFYSKIGKRTRGFLNKALNSMFPTAYPTLKAELLDAHEERIQKGWL